MDPARLHLLSRWVKNKEMLTFTVVAEPAATGTGSEESVECRDVGTARIDLAETFKTGGDVTEEDLEVRDGNGVVVGSLTVDFLAKEVFRAIKA